MSFTTSLASRPSSSYLTSLARHKADKECSRPEHDLRLLLAHVRILDRLERDNQCNSDSDSDSDQEHLPEYERKRPSLPRRVSKDLEGAELEELFEYTSIAPKTSPDDATLVSVEELEVEDWDA